MHLNMCSLVTPETSYDIRQKYLKYKMVMKLLMDISFLS